MSVAWRISSFNKISSFLSFRRKTGDEYDAEEMITKKDDIPVREVETNLTELIQQSNKPKKNQRNIVDIINMVTVQNLCSCRDPINMAFQVNCALRRFAEASTENTTLLNKLADQTEDFAVQLIDQVSAKEELVCGEPDESVRYAELLCPMTDDAIRYSQKKFVSHPLLYKRVKMMWKLGVPEVLKRHTALLWLIVFIDAALTPLMLPLVGFAFFRDQQLCRRRLAKVKLQRQRLCSRLVSANDGDLEETACFESTSAVPIRARVVTSLGNFLEGYYDYCTSPFVAFIKEKFSQWLFIVLHCMVCLSLSSVEPTLEECFIFILFCGMALNEYQQFKKSPAKYFKDMWNYLDLMVEIIYITIVILRIATIVRGGVPYDNNLLQFINCLYGINTLLMVLRVSSVLELSPVVGPLQLAMYRMLGDLLIILLLFCFVIGGFAMAITKSYKAEESYLAPPNNQSGESFGKHMNFPKAAQLLIWSVLDQKDLQEWKTSTELTTNMVAVLFSIFLIFSVIMLVNMLVALLTKTYDQITNNAEVEWKFSLAVVENQYRSMHAVAVPFNLLTVPARILCLGGKKDVRKQEADHRQIEYRKYHQKCLFPVIIQRYKKKYGGSFPLSVEEKIDLIIDRLDRLKSPTSGEIPSVNQVNQQEPRTGNSFLDVPVGDSIFGNSRSNGEESNVTAV